MTSQQQRQLEHQHKQPLQLHPDHAARATKDHQVHKVAPAMTATPDLMAMTASQETTDLQRHPRGFSLKPLRCARASQVHLEMAVLADQRDQMDHQDQVAHQAMTAKAETTVFEATEAKQVVMASQARKVRQAPTERQDPKLKDHPDKPANLEPMVLLASLATRAHPAKQAPTAKLAMLAMLVQRVATERRVAMASLAQRAHPDPKARAPTAHHHERHLDTKRRGTPPIWLCERTVCTQSNRSVAEA